MNDTCLINNTVMQVHNVKVPAKHSSEHDRARKICGDTILPNNAVEMIVPNSRPRSSFTIVLTSALANSMTSMMLSADIVMSIVKVS